MELVFNAAPIEDRPTRFLGTALSEFLQGLALVGYTLLRTGINLFLPLRLEDPDYVESILSVQDALNRWRIAGDALWESVDFAMRYTLKRISFGKDPIHTLRCDFTPSFYGDRMIESLLCVNKHCN